MAQHKQIWLVTVRLQVWSLASLSELRIWRCCEVWYTLQTWLRSCIAVVVVWAGSCSSDSTPSLGSFICHGCGPKRQKKKERERLFYFPAIYLLIWISICFHIFGASLFFFFFLAIPAAYENFQARDWTWTVMWSMPQLGKSRSLICCAIRKLPLGHPS